MTAVSIVIPMRNEAASAERVLTGVARACEGVPHEIVVVDDGSGDGTQGAVRALMGRIPQLRLIRHETGAGQSAAVHTGVLAARAPVICTMDGDGQNPASELARLYGPLIGGPARLGLVAGQRTARRDTLSKRLASRAANAIRARALGDDTRDSGCGLKAFRRDAFLALPYFDHMHRYLPALFAAQGWEIRHVDVAHRERMAGRSNYTNLQRALVGVHDLIGVAWLIRRRKRAVVLPEDAATRLRPAAEAAPGAATPRPQSPAA